MPDESDPFAVRDARIERLRKLEAEGVVRENCPEPRFWRWDVLCPEFLPEEFNDDVAEFGEIRQYW